MKDDNDTTRLRLILPVVSAGIGAAIPLVALTLMLTLGDVDNTKNIVVASTLVLVVISAILAFTAYMVVHALTRVKPSKP